MLMNLNIGATHIAINIYEFVVCSTQGLKEGDLFDSLRSTVTSAVSVHEATEAEIVAVAGEAADAVRLVFQHLVASLQVRCVTGCSDPRHGHKPRECRSKLAAVSVPLQAPLGWIAMFQYVAQSINYHKSQRLYQTYIVFSGVSRRARGV